MLVRNYDLLTHSLTRVKSRATSVAKKKKGEKLKNSWEIMGGQWEVM